MIGARNDHHIGRRREDLGDWIVDLGCVARDAINVTPGDKDRAIRQPCGHMSFATFDGVTDSLSEAILGRVKDIRAQATAHDQDGTVGKESRRVLGPRLAHVFRSRREGPGRRVIRLSALQENLRIASLIATGNENPAVVQQGGGVKFPRGGHVAGRCEDAGGGVIKKGRGEHGALIRPARDEHFARRQQSSGVTGSFRRKRDQLRLRSRCKKADEE